MLKALFVCAEKSSGLVENCQYEASCTFVEGMEEGAAIADNMNLWSGFVETVATNVKRCVPVAKDIEDWITGCDVCPYCKLSFAGGGDLRLFGGNEDRDKA